MAQRPIPEEIAEVLERQRRRVARMTDAHRKAMAKMLREAMDRLRRRLAGLAHGRAPYTLYQHRAFLAQVEQAMLDIARRTEGLLDEATRQALAQSVHDALDRIALAAKEFRFAAPSLPLQEALNLVLGDSKLRAVEERRIRQGAQRYGMDGVAWAERELAQALLTGETVDAATQRITGKQAMLDRYWKAERLVRTEFAHAYEAGLRTSLDHVAERDPDLWLQWYEHAEGPPWGGPEDIPWPGPARPLDDRVAPDSLRMHGQLRRPGQAFVDPLTGRTYAHPPNRPNDRATLRLVRIERRPATRKARAAEASGGTP